MSIFKNGEKPSLEDLAIRLDRLEKKVGFLIIPALMSALDEAVFNRAGALGHNPLKKWVDAKLRENLPDEVRLFLTEFLEKMDFSNYRSLQK
jgi:hypothetical protein